MISNSWILIFSLYGKREFGFSSAPTTCPGPHPTHCTVQLAMTLWLRIWAVLTCYSKLGKGLGLASFSILFYEKVNKWRIIMFHTGSQK